MHDRWPISLYFRRKCFIFKSRLMSYFTINGLVYRNALCISSITHRVGGLMFLALGQISQSRVEIPMGYSAYSPRTRAI